MKKTTKLAAAAALTLGLFGCSSSSSSTSSTAGSTAASSAAASSAASTSKEQVTLKVGATTSPHGVILEEAKPLLAEQGINLEIVEFSDYPNINPSTSDGSLDANYFQHFPYLESYNEDNSLSEGVDGYLVSAGAVHYEPLGIYSQKHDSVDDIEEGAQIAIPNDATNEARALYLLEDQGWITLKDGVSLSTATISDIAENPKNLDIVEIAADQVASKLPDVDYGVLNGNYALTSNVTEDLLVTEAADSEAAKTYENVIAVKEDRKDDEAIKKLVEVLKSDDIKNFIKEEFGAFAVPAE
ncbi:MetQ/NlpA family ABC transporter substrate-binding protein [Erysipelotrichaceae bacterium 51-3]|uniref:MetQ/NlpA family ABC transporter substrate-binding protein n=1 Tax=Allobaculum sp. JKK-2023 TaxID=3108943 RepID=UPI002B054981|nr:MetQ/NlpA family ABC transporter substrate-binding protein [Allobaculum sp. JKK-2023]